MSTQREEKLVPTHQGLQAGSRWEGDPTGKTGKRWPCSSADRAGGDSAPALLCPPSVPRGRASLPATSPHLAWLSGTGTPVWRCRLGDRQVRTSCHGGVDTQATATEKRPQKQIHPNMPNWHLTCAEAIQQRRKSSRQMALEQLDTYRHMKLQNFLKT